MSRTGNQRYPGASDAYRYQGRYPGSAMESNVVVWHTTEGTSLPSYGGGASAPNLTARPDMGARRLRWYQHFDFDTSARALVNRSGGVETNQLNACQVELVGTCDPKHRVSWNGGRAGEDYIFWPDAPDWALAEVAKFVKWAHDEHGVRMESTVKWTAYPESYGSGGYRLSGSEWQGYYGHLGHQHVPENDHGDPGNIDFARVLEHARGDATEEDDMPTAKEIAHEVWNWDGVDPLNPTESNPHHQAENVLTSLWEGIAENTAKIEAGNAAVVELAKALGARDEAVDVDALIARIEAAISSITVRLDVNGSQA